MGSGTTGMWQGLDVVDLECGWNGSVSFILVRKVIGVDLSAETRKKSWIWFDSAMDNVCRKLLGAPKLCRSNLLRALSVAWHP